METEAFSIHPGTANGHTHPTPPDEFARIEQAYREIQRRDSQAESHAWRWERIALVLCGVWVLTVGLLVWQFLHARQVQAFVQVVVQDEAGTLLQVGVPQALLAYAPPDGVYMDLIGQWIKQVRWRGSDPVLARSLWNTAARHTCGQARRLFQAMEEREKAGEVGKVLRTVELRSITRTPVPESYQALWLETSTSKQDPTVKSQLWSGSFSVGRVKPSTMAEALENRLGLCLTAFDISPQPEGATR